MRPGPDAHVRAQMPLPAFVCEQCQKTFASQASLDQHKKDKGDHGEAYTCCGTTFRKEAHMLQHRYAKHGLSFTCVQTKKVLPNAAAVQAYVDAQRMANEPA